MCGQHYSFIRDKGRQECVGEHCQTERLYINDSYITYKQVQIKAA